MNKYLLALLALVCSLYAYSQPRVQGVPRPDLATADYETPSAPGGENHEFSFDQIKNWSGDGTNRAAIVVQWNDSRETHATVFGYRWTGSASVADALNAIASENPRFYQYVMDSTYGMTLAGLGWDADGDGDITLTVNGSTLKPTNGTFTATGYDDFDVAQAGDADDYWQSGWMTRGYWYFWHKNSAAATFEYAQAGVSGISLKDGAWVGFTFGPVPGSSDKLADWKPWQAAPELGQGEFYIDGVYYRLVNATNHTIEVAKPYSVAGAEVVPYTGDVIIPATIQSDGTTYTVQYLQDGAFERSTVTSVTVNAAIETVPTNAFKGCANLAKVKLPESVTEIGSSSFDGCSALTTFDFLEGLTSIGARALAGTALTEVTLPATLTTIGSQAFAGVQTITSVTSLNNTPPTLAEDAFDTKIYEDVTLYVKETGRVAYISAPGWDKFAVVLFADADPAIGDIIDYEGIKYRITKVEGGKEVSVAPNSNDYGGSLYKGDIVIPESVKIGTTLYKVTAIDDRAFYRGTSLKTFVMPDCIESIGELAFWNSNMTEITMSKGLKTIGRKAFDNNISLKNITLYDGITEIPESCFDGCLKFTKFTVPSTVKKIGEYAFNSCYNLKELNLNEGLEEIASFAFKGVEADKIVVPSTVRELAESTFNNCMAHRIVIPSRITKIPKNCFYQASKLEEVVLPDGITEIGEQAFKDCKQIILRKLPSQLEKLGAYAFHNCQQFHIESLPEKLTEIPKYCFDGTNMSKLYIHDGIKTLRGNSLSNCGLSEVTGMKGVTSMHEGVFTHYKGQEFTLLPTLTGIYNTGTTNTYGVFHYAPDDFRIWACSAKPIPISDYYKTAWTICCYGSPADFEAYAHIYVPYGSKEAYQQATAWKHCYIFEVEPQAKYTAEIKDLQTKQFTLSLNAEYNYDNAEFKPTEPFVEVNNLAYKKALTYKLEYTQYSHLKFGKVIDAEIDENGNVTATAASLNPKQVYYVRFQIHKPSVESEDAPEPEYTEWIQLHTRSTSALRKGDVIDLEPICYKVVDPEKHTAAVTHRKLTKDWKNRWNTMTEANKKEYVGEAIIPAKINFYGDEYDVVEVADSAFYCSSFTKIELPNSITKVGKYAYAHMINPFDSIVLPESVTEIGEGAFYDNIHVKKVVLPSTLTQIPDYMFAQCTDLEDVNLPAGLTRIGDYAFENTLLSKQPDMSAVTYIGARAFAECKNLEPISVLPEGLTEIGDEAFYNSPVKADILLPSSLKKLGNRVFTGVDHAFTIYCMGTEVPEIGDEGMMMKPRVSNTPTGMPEFAHVHVPYGLKSEFDKVTGWHRAYLNEYAPALTTTLHDAVVDNYTASVSMTGSLVYKMYAYWPKAFMDVNSSYYLQNNPVMVELRRAGDETILRTGTPAMQDDEYTFTFEGLDDNADYEYRFRSGDEALGNLTEWTAFHTPEFIWVSPDYTDGVFILNEDWFGHDNGSINFYSAKDDKMYYRVFRQENNGKTLGVTSQFATIFGDRMYIMSKQAAADNGGRLVVTDAATMKELASIDNIGGDGRAFVGVSPQKGYVGTSSGIYPLNLEDYTLGEMIQGTSSEDGLYSGQIGDMLRMGDYIYAAAQGVGVYVISTETDRVHTTIELPNINTVFATAGGKLYAALDDDNSEFVEINPATFEITPIDVAHGEDNVRICKPWGAWRKGNLAVAAEGNVIYYSTGQYSSRVLRYDFDTNTLDYDFIVLPEAETSKGTMMAQTLYGSGLGYDPATDKLILTTTGDSFKFNNNWVLTADARTGAIEKTMRMDDYYWFPAMPLFPDNASPEFEAVLPGSMYLEILDGIIPPALDLNIRGTAADTDNLSHQIVYTATSDNENVAKLTRTGHGHYTVTAAGEAGTATITVTAESNGKTVRTTIPVSVDKTTGLGNIFYDDDIRVVNGELQLPQGAHVFTLQGYEVPTLRVEPGIYIIVLADGRTMKIRI